MRISNDLIKEIIEKVNIIDVVSGYVNLEKAGKNFVGVCPFHNDSNPSMSVNNDKKIYKCFSCGAAGDVIHFIQEYENIRYPEAVKKAAAYAGIEVTIDVNDKKYEVNKKLFEVTKISKEFYKFYIQNTKSGQVALDYLHKRGLTQDTIDRFEIGLASDKFDSLYDTLKQKGIDVSDMLECGLIKLSKSYYDLFRDRIMFPLHDEDGNVVGFSGRLFREDQGTQYKYINSPETVLFKKSETLYNLDKAKLAIKRHDRVLLYEGAMDVISVVNAGIEESVATLGTALSESHLKKLGRYTKNIVICYDGDKAGLDATNKTIDIIKKHDFNISIVVMPNGLDPDDFIRTYGSEKYINFVKDSAIDVLEFRYNYYKKDVNFKSSIDIEKFKIDVFKLLAEYKSNSIEELYFKRLAKDLSVSITAIQGDHKEFIKLQNKTQTTVQSVEHIEPIEPYQNRKKYTQNKKSVQPVEVIQIGDMYQEADLRLTKYALLDMKTAHYINSKLKSFTINDINAAIRRKIVDYYDMFDVSRLIISEFIETLNDQQKIHFMNEFKHFYTEVNQKEIDDCIRVFIEYSQKKLIEKLLEELKNPELTEEHKIQIGEELFRLAASSYQGTH